MEANQQLEDMQVYEEVEVDPSVDLGKTINDKLKEIREADPALEEVAGYLEVKDSRLGRVYLLPEIHKGLSKCKGAFSHFKLWYTNGKYLRIFRLPPQPVG